MNFVKFIFCVAQKAFIKKDNKFLILKRSEKSKSFPGFWDFAGGKLEHNEDVKKSLEREVFEETKLKIIVKEPLFVHRQSFNKIDQACVIVVACEIKNNNIKNQIIKLNPKEHSEYKWVTKEEALKLELEPFLKNFLLDIKINDFL